MTSADSRQSDGLPPDFAEHFTDEQVAFWREQIAAGRITPFAPDSPAWAKNAEGYWIPSADAIIKAYL